MKRNRKLVTGALLITLLTACAAGPDYRRPDPAPAAFAEAGQDVFTTTAFEARWWNQFGDPALGELVARALENNPELRIAATRVAEARAHARLADRDYWPRAGIAAARSEQHAQIPGVSNQRIEVESYEFGIDTLWELDLFGRARRGAEAATAKAGAAEADLHAAQVLIAAEVAHNYIELRGTQKRLAVARENLESQRESLELTRVRESLGRGSELDVASAAERVAATEAGIPPLVAAEAAAAHRLAVLIGERPGALEGLLEPREISPQLTTLAIGSPELLLSRRPDVRSAERELAAATARIGVAKAELFPRLTLSGFVGFIAGDAGDLGESSSRAWSALPVLSWAGLNGGRARVDVSEARAIGAQAAYELAVLGALEETESAFVAHSQNRRQLVAAVERSNASQRAAELARIRYREGSLDFLRLLDAERTVLAAEDAVAAAEQAVNASVVRVYQALGGGWEASPDLTTYLGD